MNNMHINNQPNNTWEKAPHLVSRTPSDSVVNNKPPMNSNNRPIYPADSNPYYYQYPPQYPVGN